jgi:hypothetical protein
MIQGISQRSKEVKLGPKIMELSRGSILEAQVKIYSSRRLVSVMGPLDHPLALTAFTLSLKKVGFVQ